MQITELRLRKVENEGKLKAYVTVTFDNCFVVHNVKIIEGKTGLFIAMPSRKTANGAMPNDTSPPKLTIEIIKAIIYIIIFCLVNALLKNIPTSSFFNLTSL